MGKITDTGKAMSDEQQTPGAMPKQVERAKARIRLYKGGRRLVEVYGSRGDRNCYLDDCEFVAEWYACHADQIDAERYRWLRAQHHSDSTLCVVQNPQDAVKPGKSCPSEEHLDNIIDKAMAKR
jgi:hypothetical protein